MTSDLFTGSMGSYSTAPPGGRLNANLFMAEKFCDKLFDSLSNLRLTDKRD